MPADYLDSNEEYYGCMISAKGIVLAIFAIMMMGGGYAMAGQPVQHITLARQAAATIMQVRASVQW